ncbi:Glycosyl transferase family 90 [bacterium A37T11]|nr:Glycosyl transferase family 90 [bacterium A37T11]
MNLRKLIFGHKNNKIAYYIRVISRELLPKVLYRRKLSKILSNVPVEDREYIRSRVNYYNQLNQSNFVNESFVKLKEISIPDKTRVYYFDSQEFFRYFDPELTISYHWGDVTFVPPEPAIVKSRPLVPENSNSVLLNLNKIRHFNFINDTRDFRTKKNLLIGRANVFQPHRIRFYESYFHHPLCDLGQINQNMNLQWVKKKLTIEQQLDYKFILSLEGHDVGSNLKWIMSSNSVAVMPTPRYETWFMEGTLIPDHHYIHIKDNYSDLEEKLIYYIKFPEKAQQIINNAHTYINQFKNRKREKLISLMVLEKYFFKTGQYEPYNQRWYY